MASDDLTGLMKFQAKWIGLAQGRALVVGSKCYGDKPDRRKLYRKAIGIDLEEGEGVDYIHDLERPLPKSFGKFDHVDCFSVMEHCKRPWLMAANIEEALKKDGTILFAVPFVWRLHGYPSDYYRFTAHALPILFPNIKWLARGYAVGDKVRKIVPGKDDEYGKWLQRAETVAVGVKCR